jgi:hypothetical protein
MDDEDEDYTNDTRTKPSYDHQTDHHRHRRAAYDNEKIWTTMTKTDHKPRRPRLQPRPDREDDEQQAKAPRIAGVILRNGTKVKIEVNEEPTTEVHDDFNPDDHHEDRLRAAMDKEMDSMKNFDVYEELPRDQLPPGQQLITTRWVLRKKGLRSKHDLLHEATAKRINDLSETYASTSGMTTLKTLLTLALAQQHTILLADVSTAFLHAPVQDNDEGVYVEPPPEYYDGTTIWKLKRAMYGLRSSPKAWQNYLTEQLQELGCTRLQSDASVYYHKDTHTTILAYVDDLSDHGTRKTPWTTTEQTARTTTDQADR